MTISAEANGETLFSGPIVDQAALHGFLAKVRDLGLALISVIQVEQVLEPNAPIAPPSSHLRKD